MGMVGAVCLFGLSVVAHLVLVEHANKPAAAAAAPAARADAPPAAAAAAPATRADAPPAAAAAAPAPDTLGPLWQDTAALVEPVQTASRSLLIGARDPNGESCVEDGESRGVTVHKDGGLGTGTAYLLASTLKDRSSPQAEYQWHQSVLKPLLTRVRAANHPMYARALRLADQADRLADGLDAVTAWPATLTEVGLAPPKTYLAFCAYRLDRAIARRDLPAARVWAREFHAAAFTLADLHRWIDFLLRNHLESLDFQAQCSELYLAADTKYETANRIMHAGIISYPGGQLGLSTLYNYLEAERQASGLFGLPVHLRPTAEGAVPDVPGHTLPAVPAAVMMPTTLRPVFLRLREGLSPASRVLWDEAALAPFDRSYLANMLFRLSRAEVLEAVETVLARFDQANPHPTRAALMDVLFYRAGAPYGGRVWADRFDPRLMDVAETLGGTNEQVLLSAQRYTRALFECWDNYKQNDTLAQALDEGRFDCIGAADMVGALYRNAGRSGFYNVRWCAGHEGHSLAGALVRRTTTRPVLAIVDGLDTPATAPDIWPDAYADGHPWPRGYPGPRPDIYAVELFAHGLDNYIWVEGYILRGPNAGSRVQANVSYLSPLPVHAPAAGPQQALSRPKPAPASAGTNGAAAPAPAPGF